MLKCIIRLDDACPFMNHENWYRIEGILDRYDIKPIVGIIPQSLDKDFFWPQNLNFWSETADRWKKKGWEIAQHGCHHLFMSHIKSEFTGLSHDKQRELIHKGYSIMCENNMKPSCFYSPAYSFDETTIDVIRESENYSFICDGYALFPHTYKGVEFIPVITNKFNMLFPIGVQVFVYHPNTMDKRQFKLFEKVLYDRREKICDCKDVLIYAKLRNRRNIIERGIELFMSNRAKKNKISRFTFI